MRKAKYLRVVVVNYEEGCFRRYEVGFTRKDSTDYFQKQSELEVPAEQIIGKTHAELSVMFYQFSPELIQGGILPSDFE